MRNILYFEAFVALESMNLKLESWVSSSFFMRLLDKYKFPHPYKILCKERNSNNFKTIICCFRDPRRVGGFLGWVVE
jgi:hypothetical protein